MTPHHSVEYCRICGAGLCGVRICGLETAHPHGLIVCDECEAIWTQPDTNSKHQYPDANDAQCPTCSESLWGDQSRWATADDIASLSWESHVNPELSAGSDDHVA